MLIVLIALFAAVGTLLLGCSTVGDIVVDLTGDEVIYISPANGDGVQDEVSIPLSVVPVDQTTLKRYAITVLDAGGQPVRTVDEAVPEGGLFSSDRAISVEVPQFVLWDGRDDAGAFVPDGEYTLAVQVWDNWENTGVGPDQRIVVDNTPPSVEVSVPLAKFSPNGDNRYDLLSIRQRSSTIEDEWVGSILSMAKVVVRAIVWNGGARDFTWDGTNDQGLPAPDGLYGYQVTSTDRAGNTGTFTLAGIQLERESREFTIDLSRPAFSPNGDGRADTVIFEPVLVAQEEIDRWSLDILNFKGESVREFEGSGAPGTIEFDGRGAEGAILDDGEYLAVATVHYGGGQQPSSISPAVAIDTQPPQAVISASTTVFSPDGDGYNDSVEISQRSSVESLWTGTLADAEGEVVATQVWNGTVSNFYWDGADSTGSIRADDTYTYTLTATDEAENDAPSISVEFRLDTRPAGVQVLASSNQFSPNGDGEGDSLDLQLTTTLPQGIGSWRLSIVDSLGVDRGIIGEGESSLREELRWDGSVAGLRLPDGQYTAELRVIYEKGNVSVGRSRLLRIDTVAPVVEVAVAPALFSPDQDGVNDVLEISIAADDESPVEFWSASIYDPAGGLMKRWDGSVLPNAPLTWDGLSTRGELVRSAENYRLVVTATDAASNAGAAETVVPVDILVIRDGDELRIQISSIYFVPYSADFLNVEPAKAARNLETVDRLSQFLHDNPIYTIRIEGHAVSLLWYDAERAKTEHQEILIPLSLSRANAIRHALANRGVDPERVATVGYGGAYPVVPHGDIEERWQNRRVEIVVQTGE